MLEQTLLHAFSEGSPGFTVISPTTPAKSAEYKSKKNETEVETEDLNLHDIFDFLVCIHTKQSSNAWTHNNGIIVSQGSSLPPQCVSDTHVLRDRDSNTSNSYTNQTPILQHSVWKARERKTGKIYAVKFVAAMDRIKKKERLDIRQNDSEVKTHRFMCHPYIIRLCGYIPRVSVRESRKPSVWINANGAYSALIMEYVNDGNLSEQVQRGPVKGKRSFNENEIAHIISQLCSAIFYLHNNRNTAHCDIKLANIVYDRTHRCIKLIDFGLAWGPRQMRIATKEMHSGRKEEKKRTIQTEQRQGTLEYLAPEQINGTIRCENMHKIDIWAIGICTYEMHYGSTPFSKATASDTMRSITMDVVHFPDDHSAPHVAVQVGRQKEFYTSTVARSFISFCLMKEAKKRPSIENILKHDWLNTVPRRYSK